ncbi:MAG: acetyl-CoA carboxylase carboxyltransferase subunit alpha [Deltaproteobacteria bacterium]|jgi:acetyl-CoA carboxylase carboxyl transferase subunit alpha|nr:acetyl-CoA carboxylase carboxyltransferase subunit alpha [Deltaproteobacteria bacterium]MBT4090519.1 acetyl-CoA carboxylase carboxyltransferase subunit alpha [Deltaproteobacteria bacterium]MBT4262891.1 acetyl-CoA carboxylase carboxyltransferase subunit alpha [Deltaproteobacteria bacterium]MBT4644196.1 acetyl-CoA carboxylase carboxyltransferase subunit alpha [Deltaproteobacteria bacterium]MBT6502706.1 acetyl-CoA carboxylase carboxyltransferase subunit alpha [Deltaproteobacteria bacterium]
MKEIIKKKRKKKNIMDFEKPLYELAYKIDELREGAKLHNIDLSKDIEKMENQVQELREQIYEHLKPHQIVKISRHIDRPTALDYIDLIFTDFIELHGDRLNSDDPSIIGGFAKIDSQKVMIIGHQKGRDLKGRKRRNNGMAQPGGYRKAGRLMKLAEKLSLPIITLVDTPGAYPGVEAEENGQAEAIARNLYEMSAITVPIITVITGEGGSGGALGLAFSNDVLMMRYSVYSTISPEGCAAILWDDPSQAPIAAKRLKITAEDLKKLDVIEDIIPEPLGGAHNDKVVTAQSMKRYLLKHLHKYQDMAPSAVAKNRYDRFRKFGSQNIKGL